MFRLFEYIIHHNKGQDQWVERIGKAIRGGQQIMLDNGFDKIVVEDFCDLAIATLERCLSGQVDEAGLLTLFQEEEQSNYLVMFLRFITSACLQANKELYSCYLEEGHSMEYFRRTEVEPLDIDADNVDFFQLLDTNYGSIQLL